jgi:hypothetical protein
MTDDKVANELAATTLAHAAVLGAESRPTIRAAKSLGLTARSLAWREGLAALLAGGLFWN